MRQRHTMGHDRVAIMISDPAPTTRREIVANKGYQRDRTTCISPSAGDINWGLLLGL
jgi:hypothetical protein